MSCFNVSNLGKMELGMRHAWVTLLLLIAIVNIG